MRNKRDSGPFSSKTTFHNSIKSRLKSASTNKGNDKRDLKLLIYFLVFIAAISDDRLSVVDGNAVDNNHPTKESIIEKLLRFFRSRPTMESLRERGIYKRMIDMEQGISRLYKESSFV